MESQIHEVASTAYMIPNSVIAQWPPSNFTDPQRRTWVAPFGIVFLCIATLVIAVRLYARITRSAGGFGLDDILIILAWIVDVLFTSSMAAGVLSGGYSLHLWDVPVNLGPKDGFVEWSSEVCFIISSCLIKISILLFYRRIVDRTHGRLMQIAIYCAIGFTIAYMLGAVLVLVFTCSPTNAYWESLSGSYSKSYKCINTSVIDPLIVALSVFSDTYALVLPQIVIYQLKMSRREKLMLYGIFASGFFVVGAGIARAIWISRVYTDRLRDETWIGFEVFVWSLTELQLAMMCASAPALKGFLGGFLREHFSQNSHFRTPTGGESFATKTGGSRMRAGTAEISSTPSTSNEVLYYPDDEEFPITRSFSIKMVDIRTKERRTEQNQGKILNV